MADDLSKRGMVGGVYRSGRFKGKKAADLTKAQLKRAETARGKKVSQKQVRKATSRVTTDISRTKFEKGRGVTKNGRLFTGTVKLASGKTATYVKGRRVVAGKKRSAGSGGGGGTTAKPPAPKRNVTTSRVSPSRRGEGAGGAKPPSGGTATRTYVHDAFIPRRSGLETLTAGQRRRLSKNNPYRTGRTATNKPGRGEKSRLQKDASGKYRWVKVM